MSPEEIQQLVDALAGPVALRVADLIGSRSEDEVGDVHDAARWIGCSVPTIERRTREGSIPSFTVGRLRRYRRTDVLAAITQERGAQG